MARGGFEPPKPLGRQIYSLLRLTAPQPRRDVRLPGGRHSLRRGSLRPASGSGVKFVSVLKSATFMASYPAGPSALGSAGAGGGIRTPDRLITNQLLYRTELRQPDKNGECSTSRATMASARAVTAACSLPHGRRPERCSRISGKMPSGFHANVAAAPRPSRHSRLPAPPSGRLGDLRGRPRAALQRRGHHVTVLAAEFDPARRHGETDLAVARRPAGRRGRQQLDVRPASTAA